MPPVSPGSGAPASHVTGSDRLVHFEGTVQLFTSTMPESSFVDFSDAGTHLVFVGCWIDGSRGDTTHVTFQAGGGVGTFKLSLPFRDDDYDKLKIQVSMRMRDDGSKNRRTVPLCSSCAYMQTMLSGQTDEFQVPDEFIDGSYARVSMSIINVSDFQKQPLQLKTSSLDRVPVMNASIDKINASIADDSVKNSLSFTKGGGQMKDGVTRYPQPPFLVVFLSLVLGVPAYVFLLPPAAATGQGVSTSRRASSRSPTSSPTTRS